MRISYPLAAVPVALAFVLCAFAESSTSSGPLLAGGSVAARSSCEDLGRASQYNASYPVAASGYRTTPAIRATLRFRDFSFTHRRPGTVLAQGCYPSGSFCNQDRQCCSRVCNKDGAPFGHCL